MKQPKFELLRRAGEIVDGIPARRFRLQFIRKNFKEASQEANPNHCGTVGCALGWLSMHPEFQEAGLLPGGPGEVRRKGGSHFAWFDETAADIFGMGVNDAYNLFAPAGDGSNDKKLGYKKLSNKALFKRRLALYLHENGQPVNQAFAPGLKLK